MLNKDEREFLMRVRDGNRLKLADRAEDRVRQSCRRKGLAMVVMGPRRWTITTAGREALEKESEE
jgi:hypothetical protein